MNKTNEEYAIDERINNLFIALDVIVEFNDTDETYALRQSIHDEIDKLSYQ